MEIAHARHPFRARPPSNNNRSGGDARRFTSNPRSVAIHKTLSTAIREDRAQRALSKIRDPNVYCFRRGRRVTTTEKTPRAGRPRGVPDQNPRRHFTNSATPRKAAAPFDSIADTIAGQQEGVRLVRDLRTTFASPDALLLRLRENLGNAAKMRGFCRALQKIIEQGLK